MPDFLCNICGAASAVSAETDFDREKPSCPCGSNVRHRWIVHQISTKLFGRSLSLQQFPVAKEFRGIGFSDNPLYADVLAAAVDFVNTRYDAEPFFDITDPSCGETESLDFIIASEVFEHIHRQSSPLLKSFWLDTNGFVAFSMSWEPEEIQESISQMFTTGPSEPARIHPHQQDARRSTRDIRPTVFPWRSGADLRNAVFSRRHWSGFPCRGFRCIDFATAPVQEFGIIFPHPWSLPCVLTKGACNVFGRI